MATASPSPTPNPDAMKYTLDVSLPDTINASSVADAAGNPFLEAVLGTDGVASVFGINDFVTITRQPGADWDAITTAVQAAAGAHL